MSNKNQISSLCKLYSIHEEIPEEYLDKTDVDSYFFHSVLDISQSHHRIVRVSKGSKKTSFAFKVFHFCDSKFWQRFILEEEVSNSKKEIESLLDSLGDFLKAFDQANKVLQITIPKPKYEIGFTKAKDELFTHCYKDIAEHLNRQIRISFRFEKNKTCVFSTKKFEHYGDQFILTEVVNLGYREIKPNTSTKIDILLLTSVTFSKAITMCSAFTPNCGYDNSTIILIGDVYCPIQSVWVNVACTKRLFNLSAEAMLNVRNARLCVRCAIFLLKNKQTLFSCRLVKVFTFLKRTKSQFKMLLEMCIFPVSFVSTERNANLLVVIKQLRDPFMVVESVQPGCLFTKFLSRYENM